MKEQVFAVRRPLGGNLLVFIACIFVGYLISPGVNLDGNVKFIFVAGMTFAGLYRGVKVCVGAFGMRRGDILAKPHQFLGVENADGLTMLVFSSDEGHRKGFILGRQGDFYQIRVKDLAELLIAYWRTQDTPGGSGPQQSADGAKA